jgi:hypothetical protein
LVADWNDVWKLNPSPGVVFIDHSPGERRAVDLIHYADIAEIVVVHDSEPEANRGYRMRDEFYRYKYVRDYKSNGAWATILSNFIDVTVPFEPKI